ncbi:2TM domain-containing protein [Flavobacterium sp.]|uniref:2TM domain-containing protein n=1 Tax=Flavobacterium sp. TaxID=239 RepID=UPI003529D3E0
MENYKSEYERYEAARKRVKEIKGFYVHFAIYIAVNCFLLGINLYFTPQHLWFFWCTIGWGIGVFFHAMGVFDLLPFFGKKWEENKIDELMNKENKSKWE